jgi:hypothetical protein
VCRRRILIIASSAKNKGSCIAGIDIEKKSFVRPIPEDGGAWKFSPEEVEILTVYEIPFLERDNTDVYQPENFKVRDKATWEMRGKYRFEDFKRDFKELIKESGNILGGYGKCTPVEEINGSNNYCSIEIIKPDVLSLKKIMEEREGRKVPKIRAKFTFDLREYDLPVTFRFKKEVLYKIPFEKEISVNIETLLTITGSKYSNCFYKFVSGILSFENINNYINNYVCSILKEE